MSQEAKRSWKERAVEELKKLSIAVVYIWVLLSVLALFRSMVLSQYHINYTVKLGFSLINAIVLAKFMWLGEVLHAGKRVSRKPLIYSMILNSAIFSVILLVCHILEEVLIQLWHGYSLTQSFSETSLREIFVLTIISFVVLIPFFATKGLVERMGKDEARKLLFSPLPERSSLAAEE